MPDNYNRDFFKFAYRTYAKRWVDEFTKEAVKHAEENPRSTSYRKEIFAHKDIIDFIKFIMSLQFSDLSLNIEKEDTEGGGYYNGSVTIDWS